MRNEESIFFGNQNIYHGCEIRFLKFSYNEGKNRLQISYYMQCIISHTLCTLELKKGRNLKCKEGNESRRVTEVKEEKQTDMSRGHKQRVHWREWIRTKQNNAWMIMSSIYLLLCVLSEKIIKIQDTCYAAYIWFSMKGSILIIGNCLKVLFLSHKPKELVGTPWSTPIIRLHLFPQVHIRQLWRKQSKIKSILLHESNNASFTQLKLL